MDIQDDQSLETKCLVEKSISNVPRTKHDECKCAGFKVQRYDVGIENTAALNPV